MINTILLACKEKLYIFRDIYGACRAMIKFSVRGQNDEKGFHDWRRLHSRTNGVFTDLVNFLIGFTRPKVHFGTVEGIAGHMPTERRLRILKEMRRDGYFVFPDLVPETVVKALVNFAFSSPSTAFPIIEGKPENAIFDPANPISPTCWHDPHAMAGAQDVQKLIADPSLLALATDYLGVLPYLMTINMWHSSCRFGTASSPSAQLYHFDLSYPGWVKFFVYLTDVSEETGPHCVVRGSHRRDRAGQRLRARGPVRISDTDIEAAYRTEDIQRICGPAGTLLMVDTRAFHKGEKPASADRLMFELEFTNSRFSLPMRYFETTIMNEELRRMIEAYPSVYRRWGYGSGQA